MKVEFRLATIEDIDLLVNQRLFFIQADQGDAEFDIIRKNCYSYFEKALYEETCDVILAEKEQKCIGTGIVFYYDSVPSKINLTGKNAYITGMYVEPEYRGRGVAKEILRRVISRVSGKGYKVIMLNASDMGRPLYEKVGFQEIHGGMILHY